MSRKAGKPAAPNRSTSRRARSSFVGRSSELDELDRLVIDGAAVVTITGFAGTGKTRLARRYAELHAHDFSGGVWFVDLTPARSLVDACGALGRALSIPMVSGLSTDDLVEHLGHAISARESTLLVLDNLEQLVGEMACAVERWVDLAVEAVFLITSRERLRLSCETCVALEPLPTPPKAETRPSNVFGFDAVKLFLDRARAVRHAFTVDDADAELLASVVRKLEGIPLAIELCATRVGVLSLGQIESMVSSRFELLFAGTRGAPARQATLRGAIDWSWSLLTPWERDALAQCTVFRGGWTLDAASEVVDVSAHVGRAAAEALRPLELLQALHDKSLVRSYECGDGPRAERRYDLLESIREYASEKLFEGGLGEDAERRHARHFAAWGESMAAAVDRLGGADALQRLVVETDNLVRAHQTSPAHAMTVLVALESVFLIRGPLSRYAELLAAELDAEVARGEVSAGAPVARMLLGVAQIRIGRVSEGILALERALALAEERGDFDTVASAAAKLAIVYTQTAEPDRAQQAAARAHAVLARCSDRARAVALDNLGVHAIGCGRAEESCRLLEWAVGAAKQAGGEREEGRALANLGNALFACGELDRSEACSLRALEVVRRFGDRLEGWLLLVLGVVAQERGRFDVARGYLLEGLAMNRRTGIRIWEASTLHSLGDLALEVGSLPEARAHYAEGLAIFESIGHWRACGIVLAGDGAACAIMGRIEEASAKFAEAEGKLEQANRAGYGEALSVLREHLTLALARAAESAGDAMAAETQRRGVRERLLAKMGDGSSKPDEVRFAIRTVNSALIRGFEGKSEVGERSGHRRTEASSHRAESPPSSGWSVRADGRLCRTPLGETVSLERRGALRRLLQSLIDVRLHAPGTALSASELVHSGWPDQKMDVESGNNRVRVAMSTLRKMGLRDLLIRRDDGYLLDPLAALRIDDDA